MWQTHFSSTQQNRDLGNKRKQILSQSYPFGNSCFIFLNRASLKGGNANVPKYLYIENSKLNKDFQSIKINYRTMFNNFRFKSCQSYLFSKFSIQKGDFPPLNQLVKGYRQQDKKTQNGNMATTLKGTNLFAKIRSK